MEALALHFKYILLLMNLCEIPATCESQEWSLGAILADHRWLDSDQQCNVLQVYALCNCY